LHAAIPVVAVTKIESWYFTFFNSFTISRSKKDLPVPAEPVKNTLFPNILTVKKEEREEVSTFNYQIHYKTLLFRHRR
jgi:hypothetical protein